MKTLRKRKVNNAVKGFQILKVKELLQVRGGDAGSDLQKDNEID